MENYNELSKEEKTKYWLSHFEDYRNSGLSQQKYCKSKDLSFWNFKHWYYILNQAKPRKKFIKIDKPSEFQKSQDLIQIYISGKMKIEIGCDATEETLSKIFKAAGVRND